MNSRSLHDLRIIVTRPLSQADSLLQELRAQGCEITHFPVLAIESLTETADAPAVKRIRECVDRLDTYDHGIFISTNAVHNGFKWINARWGELPARIHWHAIGAATAAALTEYGVRLHEDDLPVRGGATKGVSKRVNTSVNTGAMNSEALLELPALARLNQQRIVIFRGVGGREYLANKLRERGAELDYCELYRREAQQHPKGELRRQLSCQPHLLMVASVETLTTLVSMAERDNVLTELKQPVLVVPGERVAQGARDEGFSHIITAKNASLKAMLSAITSWYHTRD